jgi:hypothetical protein
MDTQFISCTGYVTCRELGEGIINCLKEGFDCIKFSLDSDDIVKSEIANKGIKGWSLISASPPVSPRGTEGGTYEISTESIDKSNEV